MNDESLRIPPHSAAAERAVLGSLLTGAALVHDVGLEEDDFFLMAHRLIYRAMQSLVMQGKPVDIVLVLDAMASAGILADVGVDTLNGLAEAGPVKNVEAHATLVRNHAQARGLHALAHTLWTATADTWRDVASDAIASMLGRSHETGRWDCDLREALHAGLEIVERAIEADGSLVGIDTGFKWLNEILGGWHDSDLTVIGARPAMGKTALLLQLALNAQVPLGIVSAEMPRGQLALRMVANQGHVNATSLRNASRLSGDDWQRITNASASLVGRPVWILDKPAPSLAEVVHFARRVVTQHQCRILFVDYMQRIKARDQSLPKHEQIGEIAMGLKELARELDIPVVVLAQVNREVEKRTNKRPAMGDLKDSGAIEQEADAVLLLYRDEIYNDGSPDKGIAEICIDKNRHGPTGTVRVAWIGEYMQFGELAPSTYADSRGSRGGYRGSS